MLLKAPRHGPTFRGSVGVARVVESTRACSIVLLSVHSHILYIRSGSVVMCNMRLARAVSIMTRCAHHNELNTHTIQRATHNASSVHTHWYIHTYDCCKHHTRRGLHKHAHSDVLYDKLHQHCMLLRIRKHISLRCCMLLRIRKQ